MNTRIIEFLGYIKTVRNLEGSQYSVISLEKSIDNIERLNVKITSGNQAKQLLPKIVGDKTSYYIDQILKNEGSKSGIKDLDDISQEMKEKIKTITEFTKIQGIGIVKALDYFNIGIKNVNQLQTHLQETNPNNIRQILGIKYLSEFEKRIPRDKINIFANNFYNELNIFNKEFKTNMIFNVMGSFIRGMKDSGDVDILLFSNVDNEIINYSKLFIDKLLTLGLLKNKLSFGNDSFQGIAFVDFEFPSIRIDIKFVNKNEELPYSILYFTGSKNFNIYMRTIARNLGYELGNSEMVDSFKRKIIVRDEGEIFYILGIKYLKPEERN